MQMINFSIPDDPQVLKAVAGFLLRAAVKEIDVADELDPVAIFGGPPSPPADPVVDLNAAAEIAEATQGTGAGLVLVGPTAGDPPPPPGATGNAPPPPPPPGADAPSPPPPGADAPPPPPPGADAPPPPPPPLVLERFIVQEGARSYTRAELEDAGYSTEQIDAFPLDDPTVPGASEQIETPPAVDLDTAGLPWDARIHAGTKRKLKNGEWAKRRNVDDKTRDAVVAELRATLAANPAPAADADPNGAPSTVSELMMLITAPGGPSTERVNEVLAAHNVDALPALAHVPHLIPQIHAELFSADVGV